MNRALAESELLNAIAAAAAGEPELNRILSAALDHLGHVVHFTGGSIAVVEDDELVIVAASGPFAHRATGQRLPRGSARSWRVIEEGTPFLSGDVVADGFTPTTPLRSYLAVPLIWEWRAFGILEVDSTEPNAFGSDDMRVLQRVATVLSGPIQMAKRYAAEVEALAETRRARARIELLSEAGRALAESLRYDTTLATIARVAIPAVADWCIVDLLGPDGTLHQVAAAHVQPEREPLIKELRRRYPPGRGHTIYRVLETGRAELVSRIRPADLAARAVDADHLRLLTDLGIGSHMVVPLQARGRTTGAMSFISGPSGRSYTPSDLSLAQELAGRAALAIDNANLYSAVSETLQRALLPSRLPRPAFATIQALYLPADRDAGVGGDWYDALLLPDDAILLSMGDVAGHGVPAAAAMGQVRHLVRAYAMEGRPPGEIISAVNRFLCALPDGQLLSVWAATLDPVSGRLVHCGAGHPPALLVHPNGTMEFTAVAGPPVGLSASRDYRDVELHLEPGSRLISYTDGLLEAARDIADAERRLQDAAVDTRGLDAAGALTRIVERVLSGTRHEDDVAVLMAELLPQTAPLEFELAAVPESLPRVRRAMRAYGERLGLMPERIEAIVLAVGEAALNVVEHAYRAAPDALVIRARPDGGSLVVEVIDRGQWRTVMRPGRGRGTSIMEGLAHTVRTSSGSDGTMVELRWTLSGEPTQLTQPTQPPATGATPR